MLQSVIAGLLFILIPVEVLCQENYRAGTLSQVSVAETWKLNTKLEGRQIFSSREPEAPASNRFQYERTDLSVMPRNVNSKGAGVHSLY
jgi:hypothetical protein